jgi:hypothetical protein
MLWFGVLVISILTGIQVLTRLALPESPQHVWMFLGAATLLTACIRWGITPLQGAPLIFGLLCGLLVAHQRARTGIQVAITLIATAFKFTLALPFVAVLVLKRRYCVVAATICVWILLNGVGFMRLGGMAAVRGYIANVETLESPSDLDTLDPWSLVSIPRVDWNYMFRGFKFNAIVARLLTVSLFAASLLWLAIETRRLAGELNLLELSIFVMSAVCLGTLAVYHHHYDMSPLLAPLLGWLLGPRGSKDSKMGIALLVPLIVVMIVVPVATTQRFVLSYLGGRFWGVLNVVFPITLTAGFAGALLLLRQVRSEGLHAFENRAARTR